MILTEEQNIIINAAKSTSDNLLVQALAGAAKTTTLELVAQALPDTQILYLVFNKKMALEAEGRLPSNCKAMTLNSLGHRTWSEATGRRLRIEASKTYNILSELVDKTERSERHVLYENFAELMRIIDFGKACGYIPTGHFEKAKRLMDCESFFNHIEQKLSDAEMDLVKEATLISLNQAFQGQCDYNDQILMPTVFHGAFPRYPLVLIDEAQDLSALNHATLRKMVKKRLIAVGDPNQAIYGFRGAHEDSMNMLQQQFSMHELTLSTSFRCPRAIVNAARWRAPTMNYPDWAEEGSVDILTLWNAEALPEAAAIICRNNAPLFALAIKLLKQGRPAELGGNDVTKSLTKVMRKFGSSNLSQSDVLTCIGNWQIEQIEKTKRRAHNGIEDRAECMRIFAMQGKDLGEALAYAQYLSQLHSPLKLMTGHKCKGLEFDHVFFLDQSLVSKKDQDPNLRYVIQTRAKKSLTYVELKDFVEKENEQKTKTNI